MSSIECLRILFSFSLVYYFLTEMSRHYLFEEVSRRLCNFSYVCFILSSGLMFISLCLVNVILMVKLISFLTSKEHGYEKSRSINFDLIPALERTFSFFEMADSKFFGISMFMVANYITGLIRLVIETRLQTAFIAYAILLVHNFFYNFIPFSAFYCVLYRKRNRN